jgi:hypothetical protein
MEERKPGLVEHVRLCTKVLNPETQFTPPLPMSTKMTLTCNIISIICGMWSFTRGSTFGVGTDEVSSRLAAQNLLLH